MPVRLGVCVGTDIRYIDIDDGLWVLTSDGSYKSPIPGLQLRSLAALAMITYMDTPIEVLTSTVHTLVEASSVPVAEKFEFEVSTVAAPACSNCERLVYPQVN